MHRAYLAAVLTVLAGTPTSANSDVIEIGVLTCALAGPASSPPAEAGGGAEAREGLCTFTSNSGAEETYRGLIRGVGLFPEKAGALIWRVKSAGGPVAAPGTLQQAYSNDPKKSADASPPLVGEVNHGITLHTMADKNAGDKGPTEKSTPAQGAILSVELKLRSTST